MPKKIKFIINITIFCLTYFIFAYPPKIFAGSQTWTSGSPTGGNEMDLASSQVHINALGSRFLSNEGLFLISGR
jgi:hypothetical protein